jgi:hypothetical protein
MSRYAIPAVLSAPELHTGASVDDYRHQAFPSFFLGKVAVAEEIKLECLTNDTKRRLSAKPALKLDLWAFRGRRVRSCPQN